MSINKSQAILKCFIYLKSIVRFTLRSENETMFCDTWNFFQDWPALELKKFLSVTKHDFVFWAQRKPNARLEIY